MRSPGFNIRFRDITMTKNNIQKKPVMQRKMERSMLGIIVWDRIPKRTLRHNTGVRDAVETILRMKWNWAGHVAKVTDGRWTKKNETEDTHQPDRVMLWGDSLETGCWWHRTGGNGIVWERLLSGSEQYRLMMMMISGKKSLWVNDSILYNGILKPFVLITFG